MDKRRDNIKNLGEHNKAGSGRKKGSKNKFTNLKDAFLKAFDELGGYKGLVKWANRNSRTKGEFYKMITKMLPANITIDPEEGTIFIISDKFLPKIPQKDEKK